MRDGLATVMSGYTWVVAIGVWVAGLAVFCEGFILSFFLVLFVFFLFFRFGRVWCGGVGGWIF